MAATWQEYTTARTGFGTVVGVDRPPSAVAGWWLYAHVVSDGSPTFDPPDTSWTSVGRVVGQDHVQEVFRHRVGASEPTSYDFTASGSEAFRVSISGVSGAHASEPDDDVQTDFGVGADPVSPAVTTTGADRLVLAFLGREINRDELGAPAGTAFRYIEDAGNNDDDNSCEEHLTTVVQAAAGSTGTLTWGPFANADGWTAVTVAVKPDAASGATAVLTGVGCVSAVGELIGLPAQGEVGVLPNGVSGTAFVGEIVANGGTATAGGVAGVGRVAALAAIISHNAVAALTGTSTAAMAGSVIGGNPWHALDDFQTSWSETEASPGDWREASSATGNWH